MMSLFMQALREKKGLDDANHADALRDLGNERSYYETVDYLEKKKKRKPYTIVLLDLKRSEMDG